MEFDMEYTIEEFEIDIRELINTCYEEIEAIKHGEQREATVKQIEQYIIPEMEGLLQMIRSRSLPDPGNRYFMTIQAILKSWSWDINKDEKLINMLPVLGNKYRHSTF